MTQNELKELTYSPEQISAKTRKIYDSVLEKSSNFEDGNFRIIGAGDVALLFRLYDASFFGGYFTSKLNGNLSFRVSKRMTRAAGKLTVDRKLTDYTISISSYLIFQTFSDIKREIIVNGLVCKDRLEAMMKVFEHEMIHLLEYMLFGDSSCGKRRFKSYSANIFGHTESTHKLITQWERALTKYDLKVGDKVNFTFDGIALTGIIYRITKRATVMVRNKKGQYRDARGNRYRKYYIPLAALSKEPALF